MKRTIPALVLLAGVLWQAPALGQEALIFTRGAAKPQRHTIKQESPGGITVFAKKDLLIPAEDLVDVEYEVSSTQVKIAKYRPAIVKEKEADKAKEGKRLPLLKEAVQLYADLGEALDDKDAGAKRHAEFKVAALSARVAAEDGQEKSRQTAVTRLAAFKAKHGKGWQLVACLRTLAQLQMDMRQFEEAEQTLRELAKAPVSDDLKQAAALQAVLVAVEAGRAARAAGKEAEAKKRFAEVATQLKTLAESQFKNKPLQQQRTNLVLAEMLTELDQIAEAQAVARQILKETTDKQVKAGAYNALGFTYYRSKKWQEARWEFLWVDVIYNQDKAEHAKALYYLADIFNTLGEGERARECLDQLLTDNSFTGLPFQRRAAQEEEARNKKEK